MYGSNRISCHFGFSDDVGSLFHLTAMGYHSLHISTSAYWADLSLRWQ